MANLVSIDYTCMANGEHCFISREENSEGKGRVGASQLLTYLSNKQKDTMKLKQRKLDMEERKLELEEKRLNLEREKWDHMFKKELLNYLLEIFLIISLIQLCLSDTLGVPMCI